MLIAPMVAALPIAPAFADVSPEFDNTAASANLADPRIQLAQVNLPPVGSLDDYVREGNEHGGASTGVPQGYSPQAMPPQGFSPQGVPPQEWNNRYVDPDVERYALIGAAVVGAVAVGLWAWQQHEMRQAQRRARKRFCAARRANPNIE